VNWTIIFTRRLDKNKRAVDKDGGELVISAPLRAVISGDRFDSKAPGTGFTFLSTSAKDFF
jgi:hypothetical protein